MTFLSVSSSLMLAMLLLALSYKTHSAPTHHLTVGVQGNTPTLIVTSSEIGIELKTVDSSKKLTKAGYAAKTSKKLIKVNLDKDQSLFIKKDTLQYLANPLTKETLANQTTFTVATSLENKGNVNKTLLNAVETTTSSSDTAVTTENIESSTHNVQYTTSTPNQMNAGPLISSPTPIQAKPVQPEVITTMSPQAATDTSLTSLITLDENNLHTSAAPTLYPKDFENRVTTINYSDDTNADIISDALKNTQTETNANDVVSQTQKATLMIKDTSVIKTKNKDDSDRYIHESIATTENENPLLTTTETKAFNTPTTPAAITTPALATLVTDNTEATTTLGFLALSLTMTTTSTEDLADANSSNNRNEQQSAMVHVERGIHEPSLNKSDKKERNKEAETKQTYVDLKPTENSTTQDVIVETTKVSIINASSNKFPQNKIHTETTAVATTIPATQPTLLIVPEQPALNILKINQDYHETITKSPDQTYELSAPATTEGVIKLIDLEKHVLKTIDELKQSTLLMARKHDNGHDGLKNIKKKQLVDKHYAEDLLHNKQDSDDTEKYLPQTAAGSEKTSIFSTTQSSAASNKALLVPIKHGYLGPILMEEKTFHVIHHADIGTPDSSHHVDDMDTQLRKGHFVELKAKKESLNTTKSDLGEVKIITKQNTTTEDKESLDMHSDQPVEVLDKQNVEKISKNKTLSSSVKGSAKVEELKQKSEKVLHFPADDTILAVERNSTMATSNADKNKKLLDQTSITNRHFKDATISYPTKSSEGSKTETLESSTENSPTNLHQAVSHSKSEAAQKTEQQNKLTTVLSTTVFQVIDSVATKTPMVQADTLFTSENKEKPFAVDAAKEQTESKISDIQIEVYDSTVDSIVASTNFKDVEVKPQTLQTQNDENYLGKTTKPPIATIQQERFTQYVIDRMETSTHEPINYSTIQVASGKPEPAAIEIHINVSESFGSEGEDSEFSYPQTEYSNKYNNNERMGEVLYDDSKVNNDNIKLKIPSNFNSNGKGLRNDEILVVEIIDKDNNTEIGKSKNTDELFITDVKDIYNTPPPPPPPPPYQTNFDRDSDTIFYISNTEVKVGESLPATKNANEERKLKLESQFFPANYMASTHPNLKNVEDSIPTHHLFEEDIILSSSRNQADSLKIYRNNNEPSPPLDVTYVGESIIEVEQSPESVVTTTYVPDQQHNVLTPQADVIIQPAILPEISIGVPVIGELPPQIELKEIDFMPNEAQLHPSGIYNDNDITNNNNNNIFSNYIDENTLNGSNNNHDADVVSGNSNSNSNQRVDESSIQYGGDLIDESADGGFDGVEGSYPFGNPAALGKSSSTSYSSAFLSRLRKPQQQQQNHVADYAHLYVNYGVNNMRKDELNADVKDSGEMLLIGSSSSGNVNVASNEQNSSTFKDFLNKVSMSNFSIPFTSTNATQSERMSNTTAFSIMEDANDLEDKSTEDIVNLISLAIGLFIVILPVVVTCSMFWALRYLYKKYQSNLADSGAYTDQMETKAPLNEDGMEKGEFVHETSSSPTYSNKDTVEKYPDTSYKPSTTDSNVIFSSEKPTSHLEISSSKTNTTVAKSSSAVASTKYETLRLSLPVSSPMAQKQAKPPPSASPSLTVATTREHIQTVHGDVDDEDGNDDDVEMPGPNGSITKMTLENNLLIVETEERNDMSRVARETKMDYNKDGVFVVEVSRGIDSKTIPESPVTEGNEKLFSMFEIKQNNGGLGYKIANEKNCVNNEKVQIHSPPPENQEEGPRSLHQIEEVEEPTNSPHLTENNDRIVDLAYKANTGLSQSDLSTTSSSDSNKGYCYGNQELYVVEQKGYSIVASPGTVVLKCDMKDIKDDDRNPGNDHYLQHSPDKKEDLSKDKKDIVDTTDKSKEGGTRTSSGQSPEQKQSDQIEGELEQLNIQEEHERNSEIIQKESITEQLEECDNDTRSNVSAVSKTPAEGSEKMQNLPIAVEIEVHIPSSGLEKSTENKTLSNNEVTLTDPALLEQTITQHLIVKNIQETVSNSPNVETSENEEQEDIDNKMDKIAASTVLDNCAYMKAPQDDVSSTKTLERQHCENITNNVEELGKVKETPGLEDIEIKENELGEKKEELLPEVKKDYTKTELLNSLATNGTLKSTEREPEKQHNNNLIENGSVTDENIVLQVNGSATIEETEFSDKEEENIFNNKNEVQKTESLNGRTQSKLLTNGMSILPDLVIEPEAQQLQNGDAEVEYINRSLIEIENGYDSIISLPEPPPTTDEQLNSDLSDQQLDSLPPPPPPEIFNIKDLPPPLINGNTVFPQSDDSTNFYNTLPPPPPNTMEATASAETTTTNGKVHASPLTPPASPPAHFTNNIHAGLCPRPIAVDVNGS